MTWFRSLHPASLSFVPSYIIGDLDSVRPDVVEYYRNHGTCVLKVEDQDSTDLQKCITTLKQLELGVDPTADFETRVALLQTRMKTTENGHESASSLAGSLAGTREGSHDLIVLGALNGRFDHCIASINTVFLLRSGQIHLDDGVSGDGLPDYRRVWLVSDMSVATVLSAGRHRVVVMPVVEGPTCGLMPIGVQEAKVVTKGLRWNIGE